MAVPPVMRLEEPISSIWIVSLASLTSVSLRPSTRIEFFSSRMISGSLTPLANKSYLFKFPRKKLKNQIKTLRPIFLKLKTQYTNNFLLMSDFFSLFLCTLVIFSTFPKKSKETKKTIFSKKKKEIANLNDTRVKYFLNERNRFCCVSSLICETNAFSREKNSFCH